MTVDEFKELAKGYIPEGAHARWLDDIGDALILLLSETDRRPKAAMALPIQLADLPDMPEWAARKALEDMRDKWVRELPERLATAA